MRTGDEVGWLFTRSDGSVFVVGRWTVPHDSDYAALNGGADMAYYALHEMARQDPLEITGIEVRLMSEMPESNDVLIEFDATGSEEGQ